MSSNDHPRDEERPSPNPKSVAFALDIETLSASNLTPLLTYARHHRRLWMVAIPGFGLVIL